MEGKYRNKDGARFLASKWLKAGGARGRRERFRLAAFWLSGVQGDCISSPAKSAGDREHTNPLFFSHLVSPKSPFPGAVSLLLSRELARHNNGNQTPNQTCPPCAPSSGSHPPRPSRPPASRLPRPNRACHGWAGKSRRVSLALLAPPPEPARPALALGSPGVSAALQVAPPRR